MNAILSLLLWKLSGSAVLRVKFIILFWTKMLKEVRSKNLPMQECLSIIFFSTSCPMTHAGCVTTALSSSGRMAKSISWTSASTPGAMLLGVLMIRMTKSLSG